MENTSNNIDTVVDYFDRITKQSPKWSYMKTRVAMTIGANIIDLIEEKFKSKAEFISAIGITDRTLSNWLCGFSDLPISKICKIAEVLGVEFEDLIKLPEKKK